MKSVFLAAVLSLGASVGVSIAAAHADPLQALKSACRTGIYSACSDYNAAIIARNAAKNPVTMQTFNPFMIVPAIHSERTPKAPATSQDGDNAGLAAAVPVKRR